jgi:hypothetical protein
MNAWAAQTRQFAAMRQFVAIIEPCPRIRVVHGRKQGEFAADCFAHLALRDIKAKRTKFTPVSPEDLKTLMEMGLVEICDEAPLLTLAAHRTLDR